MGTVRSGSAETALLTLCLVNWSTCQACQVSHRSCNSRQQLPALAAHRHIHPHRFPKAFKVLGTATPLPLMVAYTQPPSTLLPPYRCTGDLELIDNLLEWQLEGKQCQSALTCVLHDSSPIRKAHLIIGIGRVEVRTFGSCRALPLAISLSNHYMHGRVSPLTPHNPRSCQKQSH